MNLHFSSSNNATNDDTERYQQGGRKPKPYFEQIQYNDPDPNEVTNTQDWERRYFLMLPKERERARREEHELRLHQAGLIDNLKYTKNTKTGQLVDDIVFTPPYPKSYLSRLGNAYEFDSIVRTGIDTLVHYILGRDFYPRFRPVVKERPRDESEYEIMLNDILPEEKRMKYLDYVNYVDHTVKLKQVLKPLLVSKYTFGRAAGLVVRADKDVDSVPLFNKIGFIEGTPFHIKALNSYYLAQNHYDTRTWEVKEIEYDDPKWIRDPSKRADEQPPLKIEDLIYFTHADYNIIPNSFGYGMSALENILSLSGANRRINEKVLPELNTQAWAGTGIFKFVGMSAKQMANFVKSILPSTWKATNQEMEYIPIKIDFKDEWLLQQRDSNVKHIATQLRIPSFLINFEDVTNRSIGDRVSNIWQQGDLEFARDELRDQLWEFWYRRLMELYFPEEEFLYIRAKIIIEFQSIDFSNFFEKAIAGGNLVQNAIMSVDEIRELLGKGPYTEDQTLMEDNIIKYLNENPDILENVQNALGLVTSEEMKQMEQQNQQQQKEGTIGQQGLSANVNPQKIKKGDFDSGDVVTRLRRGVKQAKNFR